MRGIGDDGDSWSFDASRKLIFGSVDGTEAQDDGIPLSN